MEQKKRYLVITPDNFIISAWAFDEYEAIYYAQKYDNYKYRVNKYLILKNYEVYRPYND